MIEVQLSYDEDGTCLNYGVLSDELKKVPTDKLAVVAIVRNLKTK